MNTTSNPDPKSVEEKWDRILREHGVDPELTDNLIASLKSGPRLTSGPTSDEEVRSLVTRAINQLPLADYGVDSDDVPAAKEALKEALDAGLEGDLEGPSSAQEPESPLPWPDEPVHIEMRSPVEPQQASDQETANEANAAGYVDVDEREEIQPVADALRGFIQRTGHDIEELEAALDLLKTQRKND